MGRIYAAFENKVIIDLSPDENNCGVFPVCMSSHGNSLLRPDVTC